MSDTHPEHLAPVLLAAAVMIWPLTTAAYTKNSVKLLQVTAPIEHQ